MKDSKIKTLARASVLTALVTIATLVIPIPLPGGGYANAGDIVLLMSAYILGPGVGAAAGGIGSCIADLVLGYGAYAPGTLVVKSADTAMAGVVYMLCRKKLNPLSAMLISGVAGEIIMVLGYFGYEALILQSGIAAAVGMVPNLLQGAAGVIGSTLLMLAVGRFLDREAEDK